jgi:acyl-CoA synthetase (AMP-forming)/AMP-acid ligase II
MSADFRPSSAGTIPRLVQDSAARYGDLNAFESEEGSQPLSFVELGAAMERSARAFIAAGLEPGERVGIWANNCIEWVLAAIGLQAVGGVLVPLNTRFKGPEAAYILNKSRARLLFTVSEFLGAHYVQAARAEALSSVEKIVDLSNASDRAEALPVWDDRQSEGSDVYARASPAWVRVLDRGGGPHAGRPIPGRESLLSCIWLQVWMALLHSAWCHMLAACCIRCSRRSGASGR